MLRSQIMVTLRSLLVTEDHSATAAIECHKLACAMIDTSPQDASMNMSEEGQTQGHEGARCRHTTWATDFFTFVFDKAGELHARAVQ